MRSKSNALIKDKEMRTRKMKKNSPSASLKPRRSKRKRRLKSNNKLIQTMMKNMNLQKMPILTDSSTPIKSHTTRCPRQNLKLIRKTSNNQRTSSSISLRRKLVVRLTERKTSLSHL